MVGLFALARPACGRGVAAIAAMQVDAPPSTRRWSRALKASCLSMQTRFRILVALRNSLPALLKMRNWDILGLRVTSISLDEVYEAIATGIHLGAQRVFLYQNVHNYQTARAEAWLREFQWQADVVWCDGKGVQLGAWLLGAKVCRHTMNQWRPSLEAFCADNGFSLFLLGGQPGLAARAAVRARRLHRGIKVAGFEHGFFSKHGQSNERIVDRINAAQPDILLVGMGTPVQERWVRDNRARLNAPAIITCGAYLEVIAGARRPAPYAVSRCGLEWLYLSLQKPRRFFTRYSRENPAFLAHMIARTLHGDRAKE